ncbi:MAG: hypothetical protein ACRD2U_05915 [Terriglobales bacterium]
MTRNNPQITVSAKFLSCVAGTSPPGYVLSLASTMAAYAVSVALAPKSYIVFPALSLACGVL